MKYHEIFLMNQIYVTHPTIRIPPRLCPRDEISHPNKIIDIIFMPQQRWRAIEINQRNVQYRRIEYDKEFYDDISSSHLYVISEKLLIFEDARRVDTHSSEDMLSYLSKHHSNMFVITCPVFRFFRNSQQLDTYYSIPVNVLNNQVFIEMGTILELRNLIDTQCYTVCNGLTIFLAMVRGGVWSPKEAGIALKKWVSMNNQQLFTDADDIFDELWQYLYTIHPVPMIANFPAYYATMYPPVPCSFFTHLKIEDSIPLSQFIQDIDGNNVKCLYASPITSMFPYFNKSIFDYYNPKFLDHDTNDENILFQTPFELDYEDLQQLDIEGFIIGIIRSRRAWKWWKQNGPVYLRKIWDLNNSSHSFFNHFLQILFYLYDRPYKNIKYSKSRIRSIWNMALIVFNISHFDIYMCIATNVIKKTVYNTFNVTRLFKNMPMSFLIDVFTYYHDINNDINNNINKNKIEWFCNHKYKLYTHHDTNVMLAAFAPFIHLNDEPDEPDEILNDNDHEYILTCSIYNLLKLDPDYNLFIKHIIDKRIAKKILCIDKIFGLQQDESTVLNISDSNAYVIGMIFKDYLQSHRENLI